MIAVFNSKQDAQNFADKIYNWLLQNCPNVNGICWQVPFENKAGTQWYIEIPQEYYKEFYPGAKSIIAATSIEYQRKTSEKEKPDPILWNKEISK